MKKRFTIMLDEEVIRNFKSASTIYTPKAVRQYLEDTIKEITIDWLIIKNRKYQFDDGDQNGN